MKTKLRKGDLVRVIAGKHKGLKAPILKINRQTNKVELENVTVYKHVKPNQQDQEGGIQKIPAYLHCSNVALVDPKNKENITKISYVYDEQKKKTRVSRKSNAKLG